MEQNNITNLFDDEDEFNKFVLDTLLNKLQKCTTQKAISDFNKCRQILLNSLIEMNNKRKKPSLKKSLKKSIIRINL